MKTFFLLMCAHALCDFQLQNGAMHERKASGCGDWYIWMLAHALICGGGVFLVTGSLTLGVIETVAHFVIDTWKTKDSIGLHADQLLHILFRIVYTIALTAPELSDIL